MHRCELNVRMIFGNERKTEVDFYTLWLKIYKKWL